jgi:hypothetical protein
MAGSISVTKTDLGGAITKYSIAWTADASGNVNSNSFDIKRGHLIQAKFIPGSPAPANNYTVKLNDPDGADLLAGIGSGTLLSSTVANYLAPLVGISATAVAPSLFVEGFSAVTPVIAATTNGGKGTINLYVGP